MCMGGSSRPATPQPQYQAPPKPVVYMRNRYLDGLGISGENAGRNSLRIDMAPQTRNPAPIRTGGPTPPMVRTGLGISGA